MSRVHNARSAYAVRRALRAESGFVLPTAIFLLVILAALAAFMVALSRSSHISSALDLQGSRAYQAARAGIEWAAWKVVDPQNLQPSPAPCPASPTAVVLTGTLASFAVNVSCTRTLATDGADTVAVYQITSTATSGVAGETDYVERQIQASFAK
jgi:MSHA biogenesis protein MshP